MTLFTNYNKSQLTTHSDSDESPKKGGWWIYPRIIDPSTI